MEPTERQLRIGKLAAVAPMDGATGTVPAAIGTVSKNLRLAPGIWKVSLRGADSTVDVYLNYGADDTVIATEPADVADKADGAGGTLEPSFRGDEIERITVTADKPYVAFILSTGGTATKIKFVRVVQ